MKELKIPWVNWHSPEANIPVSAFRKDDDRRKHPWFTNKDPGGAYTFEFEAARPAITRWAERRFQGLRRKGGTVPTPRLIMEQIVTTPTVNLVTTSSESRRLRPNEDLFVPSEFFVDIDALSLLLVTPGPAVFVPGKIYLRCLEKFDVRLKDGSFKRRGDTHFCFLIPERAFEDQEVLASPWRSGS